MTHLRVQLGNMETGFSQKSWDQLTLSSPERGKFIIVTPQSALIRLLQGAKNQTTANIPFYTLYILSVRIKVNLFHVTWLAVMFFMPRAEFICCAVLLIHHDLILCSAQQRAI